MRRSMERYTVPCTQCQAGQMHQHFITYFTWLGDELITVPDFPAWICDVCGHREYDPAALNQLSLILSPNAGRPVSRSRGIPHHRSDKKGQRASRP